MEVTVAPITEADCEELGRVQVEVWREAYAGLLPADHLAGLDPAARAEVWRRIVGTPGDGLTVVARDPTGLLGFASGGPCRDEDEPAPWEVMAVYLLARARGKGLADEMLRRVAGDRAASLWVFEDNPRARAFYARHGFVPDGAHSTYGKTGTPEIRMVRPAAASRMAGAAEPRAARDGGGGDREP